MHSSLATQTGIKESFDLLRAYCEQEAFRGWDPYDGLNSLVFRSLPGFKRNRWIRLAWIQAFKRNPLNLRRPFLVKKDYNPKGLGLFLHGYCNRYRTNPQDNDLDQIRHLVDRIVERISPGYSGACWGYNFDWQAKAFFQPAGTPTVVASTFIGYALYEAYDILKDPGILNVANSVSDFILNDLNRTYDEHGNFAFSYSPLDRSQVFNASLLGSRMLARTYSYTGEEHLITEAGKSVDFCIDHQQEDGSWSYSTLPYHQWIDSFHTGYNLECIYEFQKYSGYHKYQEAIDRGVRFYLDHFVTDDGRCKYYHDSLYPIDIHAPSQLIVTLSKLRLLDQKSDLAARVLHWVIHHMQDRKGYFYFQIKHGIKYRIPYIRWAQAWMFYALSEYLKHISQE